MRLAATIFLQADTDPASRVRPDTVFWWTIGLIFLVAIIGTLVRRRQRDRALRLLDASPVTVILASGQAVTGQLAVASQGIEVLFEVPEETATGLVKRSMLIYEPELITATAILRAPGVLDAEDLERRRCILKDHIDPGLVPKLGRAVLNLFNTTRDAVVQSIALLLGRLRPIGGIGAALRGQEQGLVGLSNTVVGLAANAYEPLLERHRGEPVIVQLTPSGKPDPPLPPHELAGHLIAYTDKFLCIMAANGSEPSRDLVVASSSRTAGSVSGEGLRIERDGASAKLVATGPEAVVLRGITASDQRIATRGAVLIAESRFEIENGGEGIVEVRYELTHSVDLVAPRARAQVRHAGTPPVATR